jgi:hypothetical protein
MDEFYEVKVMEELVLWIGEFKISTTGYWGSL